MTDTSDAHTLILPAGNETYHARCSIRAHGELAHAHTYATLLVRDGQAASVEEALTMASAELRRLKMTESGYMPHREARRLLDGALNADASSAVERAEAKETV